MYVSPYVADPTTNPGDSLRTVLTTSPRDYSILERDAWTYGIIIGWNDEALKHLTIRHRWSAEEVARLKELHRKFVEAFNI